MGRVSMTVLDGLASLIGFSETCVLAAVYAGRSLYVPKTIDAEHQLSLLIGLDAAQVLVSQFGGGEAIKIPAAFVYDRYVNIMRTTQMAGHGLTAIEIAAELKVSVRTVHEYLKISRSLKIKTFKPSRRNKKHQNLMPSALALHYESPDQRE